MVARAMAILDDVSTVANPPPPLVDTFVGAPPASGASGALVAALGALVALLGALEEGALGTLVVLGDGALGALEDGALVALGALGALEDGTLGALEDGALGAFVDAPTFLLFGTLVDFGNIGALVAFGPLTTCSK